MTNKQKSVIEYLDEVYYKENEGKKGNLITQVKTAQKELKDQKDLVTLTDEEWSKFLESARLLREESTDSIGIFISFGAVIIAFFAVCISQVSVIISVTQSKVSYGIATLAIVIFALIIVYLICRCVKKNARRADRYRSIILALLLPKDDEPQNKASETKSSETEANEIKQGEIKAVEPKQNESK